MKVFYKSVREQIQKLLDEQTPGKRVEKIVLDADEWSVLYRELQELEGAEALMAVTLINAGSKGIDLGGIAIEKANNGGALNAGA